ncbi:MAG: phosphoribosylglycinamide formyltransferase [Sedimentisphaerales bacterium]|nr:phosphoribosylglycinamide formyltransferase [Sedimentisphaerales bacterium]
MAKIKLGIMLSGGGRTMVNIAQQIKLGKLDAEIVTVISSRSDVAGIERARELGIEPIIIRRKDFADNKSFSSEIARHLIASGSELICQCGWMCFWTVPCELAGKVMNIHPSLLPSFGGQGMYGHHVHEALVKRGCKISGCTVHFVTNEYDAGPIIVQRTCPIEPADDADTVAEKVFEQECLAYPEAIRLYADGKLRIADSRVFIDN